MELIELVQEAMGLTGDATPDDGDRVLREAGAPA
jgi:hypothetical protein